VTDLVLARPADTWAHRGIDSVPPDDNEIEAVLAHMSVERLSRLICLDHLVTDTDGGRDAFMSGLGRHFGQGLAATFSHVFDNLVRGLGM